MRDVSVVVPVYNEAAILQRRIRLLARGLEKSVGGPFEIILVENGSQDGTWEIIQSLQREQPNLRGLQIGQASYGGALREGILAARGEAVAVMNVDFWDLNFLREGLALLQSCHIVNGSKTLSASKDRRPLFRRLVTQWFNILLRIVFNFPGTDTHGIKVFRREPFLPIVKRCITHHELFDTELVLRACRRGMVLAELPITVKEIRPTRYNHFRRIFNTLNDIKLILGYLRLQ